MTYLELCQEVARESQVISGNQPTTTASQSGLLLKVVEWTKQAWLDVQRERTTWQFMRNDFAANISAGTKEYSALSFNVTDLGSWITEDDSSILYLTATGVSDERVLPYMPWDSWKRYYNIGVIEQARPASYTIKPATRNIVFGPTPDDTYTFRGEYYRQAQTFSDNSDTPTGLDSEFDQIIVQRALMLLHGKLKSANGYADARANYMHILDQMRTKYLPEMNFGEPLA